MSRWGAIFDFDGVVVDSADHHELCWKKVADEFGGKLTHEQFLEGFGVKNGRFISEILGWTDDAKTIDALAKRKEELFQEHIKTTEIALIPGLEGFLHKLKEKNIPCCIASSSILKNIDLVLQNRPIKAFFPKIVSGEDVKEGKPDPQCFLEAAKRLNLPAKLTVVFEDALLGVEAANRAGALSVALTTTFPKEKFQELACRPELIVKSFLELNPDVIDSWFQ